MATIRDGRVCRRLVLPRGNVGLHMMREVIALTTQH